MKRLAVLIATILALAIAPAASAPAAATSCEYPTLHIWVDRSGAMNVRPGADVPVACPPHGHARHVLRLITHGDQWLTVELLPTS
jgi:hypothetical protein